MIPIGVIKIIKIQSVKGYRQIPNIKNCNTKVLLEIVR